MVSCQVKRQGMPKGGLNIWHMFGYSTSIHCPSVSESDPLVVQFENPRWQQPSCLARGFKIWFHQPRGSIFYIQFMTSLQTVWFASVQNIIIMCFHCRDHSSPENSHTGTTGFFLYYSECCTAVTAPNHATLHTLVLFCTVTVMRAL